MIEENAPKFADGFDDALIGIGTQFNTLIAVYDYNACVRILQDGGMSYEDAIDHMEYNVTGSWVGENTPVFIRYNIDDYREVEEFDNA